MSNYIGNQPSAGEFKKLDSIASSFNGSLTQFDLDYSTVNQSVGDATQLIVSLNGIIQEPGIAYTLGIGGGSIVFASAPASGDTCHIVLLGGVGGTTTPTDGSVTASKLDASLKDYLEETFTANGSQTVFTLTRAVIGANNLLVTIDGIVQPSSAFTASGTTLTISEVLAANTNVRVVHMGVKAGAYVPANDSITTDMLANSINTDIASKLPLAGGTLTGNLGVTGTVTSSGGVSIQNDAASFSISNAAVNRYQRFRRNSNNSLILDKYNGSTATNTAKFDENGDISFYEATGTTPKFFWDASAERLFVGDNTTTMPTAVTGAGLMVTGTSPTGVDGGQLVIKSSELTSAAGNGGGLVFDNYNGVGNRVFGAIQVLKENSTSNNNDSFMRFTTRNNSSGLAEAMRINSSGNVGIGTSSPSSMLNLKDWSGDGPVIRLDGAGQNSANTLLGALEFYNADNSADGPNVTGAIRHYSAESLGQGGYTTFHTHDGTEGGEGSDAPERMRIDSSGNLLVGTANGSVANNSSGNVGIKFDGAQGQIQATGVSDAQLYLNRQGTDGTIAEFRKDGTAVGSIGVQSTDQLYIATPDGSGVGLIFDGDNRKIDPTDGAGSNLDNAVDLGTGAYRFKDLYLSGGVYLGGTGSANKLEDYEEGTWTPVIYGTGAAGTWSPTGNNGGGYVKIGNQVTCWLNAVGTLSGASGDARISGLPFPNAAVTSVRRNAVYSTGSIQYWAGISVRVIAPLIEPGQTTMYFHTYGTNDTQGGQPAVTNTSHNHHSFVTYMVE